MRELLARLLVAGLVTASFFASGDFSKRSTPEAGEGASRRLVDACAPNTVEEVLAKSHPAQTCCCVPTDYWTVWGIGWLSVLIAGGTAFVSWRAHRLARWRAMQGLRNYVRAWGDECVNVIQEGITCCFNEMSAADASRIAGLLSALIDRGRWHFENDRGQEYGRWKEGAYQGLAPAAIDFLKCAHNALVEVAREPDGRPVDRDALRKRLVSIRRRFVTELQEFLEPAKALREVSK